MRKIIIPLIVFIAISMLFLIKYSMKKQEISFLESYCENLTKVLLSKGKSCYCYPAQYRNLTGCTCECRVGNATKKVFIGIVENASGAAIYLPKD